jgi:hypothetical protein
MGWQNDGGSEIAAQVSFDGKIDVFARHSHSLLAREYGSDKGCLEVGVGRIVGVE